MRLARAARSRRRVAATTATASAALALAVLGTTTLGASPAAAASPTAFGAVVKPRAGETWPQAMARAKAAYGQLGEIRYFSSKGPEAWTSLQKKVGQRPLIVSFKYPPAEVLSGQWDDALLAWFRSAPTNRRTWYSYIHEPENDIKRGAFTAADYRAAWQRIAALSQSVGNPYLKSTLILMCYTVNPTSNRNWLDYFPGKASIDVIGWDCYNHSHAAGGYDLPQNLMGNAVATSKAAGMPYGMAEIGSLVHDGDDGTGRAKWLVDAARYLDDNGALFVNYFDSNGAGADYRLLDAPSQQAWYSVVSDQNPY